ncbi:hypothetical protein A2U01_0073452, partial [Trifolium medium]|nr:hypothetical protein [Trifolium medium]
VLAPHAQNWSAGAACCASCAGSSTSCADCIPSAIMC